MSEVSCPGGVCPMRRPATAATGSEVAVVDEYKYTPLKKGLLMGTFLLLAGWAFKCPCPEIFTCDRNLVVPLLGAIFLYVFISTEPK